MLRATTACTFSTYQLPKVVRSSSVLSILTWKCASRHNGVHFFMSHLASWLRTRRFSEPTFRPSGATNHWKNTVNRDFPIFSRIYPFFLLIFSLLSASSLLCVSTVHIVGSLASKLPSINIHIHICALTVFKYCIIHHITIRYHTQHIHHKKEVSGITVNLIKLFHEIFNHD